MLHGDGIVGKVGHYRFERAVCHALCSDQFHLNYQPKFFLDDGRLQGGEVLLRWRHPEWGWMSPAHFVPFIERRGLACELFEWVLLKVCRQVCHWASIGLRVPGVAINLSPAYLEEGACVSSVMEHLGRFDIDPSIMELEITETSLFFQSDRQLQALTDLRRNGLGIALDDFGTGYSSLTHLARMPVTSIKIDKFFIDRVGEERGAQLVESIIRMGRELGLQVVAEGVEEASQVEFLRDRRCAVVQGYYFSSPLDERGFEAVLRRDALAHP